MAAYYNILDVIFNNAILIKINKLRFFKINQEVKNNFTEFKSIFFILSLLKQE